MAHVLNPTTREAEAGCEFKARLIYRASSRTMRPVAQRNPCGGGSICVLQTGIHPVPQTMGQMQQPQEQGLRRSGHPFLVQTLVCLRREALYHFPQL